MDGEEVQAVTCTNEAVVLVGGEADVSARAFQGKPKGDVGLHVAA